MKALWDLGNVVVRWDPEVVLQMFDLNPQLTDYLRTNLLGHSDWLALDRGVTTEAEIAKRLVSESDLTLAQAQRCFDVVRASLVDLKPSLAVIKEMKSAGVPMYVLSNMSTVNADYLRKREYFDLFDGVVISGEEKLIKPEADLFKVVLDRFNVTAAELYFIDDSLPNIEAAKELGMQAQHFHRTEQCYATLRKAFKL